MTTTPLDPIRCEAPIFYATTEGQTRRIAERLVEVLADHGIEARAFDMAAPEAAAIDWAHVHGALVGASLHMGRHQRAAALFVHQHAAQLNAIPSAFFSVSLSAASSNPKEVEAARSLAREFPLAHGWTPAMIASLAGRLAYTRYNFLTRLLIKRIARKEGAPTDTSRDYELTNWEKVEKLGLALVGMIYEAAGRARKEAGGTREEVAPAPRAAPVPERN